MAVAEPTEFSATEVAPGGEAPGAIAAFPYDRMTVEQFRAAFPRARWRDELKAWFVPGTTATRRLEAWRAREWTGVLRFADDRGRDAFAFEPIRSRYLEAAEELVVRTPYSRTVIEALRTVPWARWDPDGKAWRVPYRSYDTLRRQWPAIEEAAARAEPEERRRRRDERRATAEDAGQRAQAAERRRHRYPVPDDALPVPGRVLMTHVGVVVFEAVTGELVEADVAASFYPGVSAGNGTLIWSGWRRPSHGELVQAWPARSEPDSAELARGWWQPTIGTLRSERRKAASLERAAATRTARAAARPGPETG